LTKEEFNTLVMAMKAVYPSANFIPDKAAFEIWYEMVCDISYATLSIAIKVHISNNKFPPTIADLRELCSNITAEKTDYGQAWQEVMKSIQRWGMYREEEALEKMDPMTRQVVQRLGFRSICTSENITADRANFRMIFEELSSREKTNNQVPQKLREQIEQIRNAGMQKIENKGE